MAHAPSIEHQHQAGSAAPPRRTLLLLLLSLAQFMVVLDVTVVNVALPEIGRALQLSRDSLTWLVTAYTLTLGGLLILGGRLADAVGRKTTFLTGLGLFTAASLTAGLATGGAMLLSARVVQGVGAALLSPSALSIMTTEFTGAARTRALSVWAAIGGAGAAIGVLLGGALTSGPGWEWIFYINVPVGVLVGLAAPTIVPSRAGRGVSRIDVPGALVGTAAVASLIYGLIRAGDTGWTSASALLPIGAAVLLAAGFVAIERSAAAPLVPLTLLRRGPLSGAVLVMIGATGVLLSGYFLTSIYLQQVRDYSPVGTGLAFLPVAIATILGAHLAGGLIARVGARRVAAVGQALAAVGLGLLAWRGTEGTVLSALLPGFVLASAGVGAVFVAATTSGLRGLDHRHAGVGSGILNTGHELGASLGVAVVSAIASSSITGQGSDPLAGFENGYLAGAIAAAVLAVASTVLLPQGRPAAGDPPIFAH